VTSTDLTERLATVVVIPVTPFAEDGGVDEGCYAGLVQRLLDGGIGAVTPNGNTGEFYTLTPDERRLVLQACTRVARHRAVVVAGVGLDVATAIAEARVARDAGAHAIMIHQPVHPYLAPAGWVEYNAAIAAAVPELGVLPYLKTRAVTGRHIAELAQRAPNVVGLKYSVDDPVHFAATRADAGDSRLLWIAGLAEPYAPSYWQAGARGFTSGLANVAPQLSLQLLASLQANDLERVRHAWLRVRRFEELRARNGAADNVSVVKEAMAGLGLCRRDVRPPNHELGPEQAREVAQSIAGWPGVASWSSPT
jgi:4-hydroxy-tetrahydrodipicolinate synthase